MLMFDLPQDLIEEIFSRVPATTLIRLRTTCKLCYALLKNPSFTEKHFLKAPKQSLMIMVKDFRVYSMIINLNVVSPSIELKHAPSLIDSRSNSDQVDIYKVFHCLDGLLLCITTKEDRLVVWNPCLGETKLIQLRTVYDNYSKFALGYENNKSCTRNYKILRFCYCYGSKRTDEVVWFEVYDFRSDSWRVGYDVSLDDMILGNGWVSLKGNSYWPAFDKQNRCKLILSFDFSSERFKPMYLPTSMNPTSLSWYCRSLSVVREEQQLSTSQRNLCSRKFEIWVTNNIETATETTLSWTKSFTISDCCSVFSSLLINEEKKVVVCCSFNHVTRKNSLCVIGEDDKYYTEIPVDISWWTTLILSYVPSLVQIQQKQEAKEKTEIN